MKETPILYTGPMVRAVLERRKTQTRRVVTTKCDEIETTNHEPWPFNWSTDGNDTIKLLRCPYGQPGDRLWVRENVWMWCEKVPNGKTAKGNPKFRYVPVNGKPLFYATDRTSKPGDTVLIEGNEVFGKRQFLWRFKVGRFMPRWASRITLEIVSVRVERLQDISEADALAEGVTCENVIVGCNCNGGTHREEHGDRYFFDGGDDEGYDSGPAAYRALWESIHGKGSWEKNPHVWVIEFRKL